MDQPRRPSRVFATICLLLLAAMTGPFALHASLRPWDAWRGVEEALGRVVHADDLIATLSIYAHMIPGGLITVAVPIQLIPAIRHRWPRVHRASGYVLTASAVATGLFGLVYIGRQGTVGGPWMSGWFALYGGLMILAAASTVHFARKRDFARHQRWALRLLVLAVASFLYRVHYGLWYIMFDGRHVAEDFTGAFDRANVWAFYLPYLIVLEIMFAWSDLRRRRAASG